MALLLFGLLQHIHTFEPVQKGVIFISYRKILKSHFSCVAACILPLEICIF